MRVTCPTDLIFLHFINLVIFDENRNYDAPPHVVFFVLSFPPS
jgi:hypothetical protein